MDDPWQHPDFKAYAAHVSEEVLPKLLASGMTISLAPREGSDVDVKFACELGLSIMLDKPIIVVADPGSNLPERLIRVADHVLYGRVDDPNTQHRLAALIKETLGDT